MTSVKANFQRKELGKHMVKEPCMTSLKRAGGKKAGVVDSIIKTVF